MKKLIIKFFRFLKKRKYYVLAFFFILFIWWWNCLPKELFNKPTSTVLLDKNGNLLNALIADDGQWRFPHNNEIPDKFKAAIIEFEDHMFYSHLGVSARGIARAIKQNISNGKIVSGGSTISMQVIRMSRNKKRTLYQKLVEMIWSTRLEARYTKDEILAIYSSNAPMGGNVVGLDAASWRYFQRSPRDLSWAETATLAVLPNAPSLINVEKNREELKNKRDRLLNKLFLRGKIDKETMEIAMEEPLPEKPLPLPQLASHLLNRVISEKKLGKSTTTTLDVNLQKEVMSIVEIHHQRLKSNNIFNAAVIVGDIKTGEILSYVGNTNVKELEHGGAVDVISSPRSSGSILKPFLYAFMQEDGYITPEQVIYDVPTTMAGYSPENYNQKYAGIVPADEALSKSLNVPFVRMLRDYGVQKFHSKLKKLGLTTLNKPASHYGLSLILGGCEVKLFDLVNMYSKMSKSVSLYPNYDSTVQQDLYYSSEIKSNKNTPAISPSASWFALEAMQKVVRPNKEKNWQEFNTSQRIAWKTGTSYGFRDAWAIGLNKNYVVGVWIGNADGEGRPGIIGVEAAAPLLFDVFDFLPKSNWYEAPFDDMKKEKICKKSGSIIGEYCDEYEENYIPKRAVSTLPCSLHKAVFLDAEKKHRVTSDCYEVSKMEKVFWFTLPPKVAYYYQKRTPDYIPIPSYKNGCVEKDELSQITILYPKPKSKIVNSVTENGLKSQVIMEAIHRDENVKLFWHLDDNYLGETTHLHQIQRRLEVGKHTLKILDELGNSEKVEFEVVKD